MHFAKACRKMRARRSVSVKCSAVDFREPKKAAKRVSTVWMAASSRVGLCGAAGLAFAVNAFLAHKAHCVP